MVISQFYESFLLSKNGILYDEKTIETFSPKDIFKNIDKTIENARKKMRNKKGFLFRANTFTPSPFALKNNISEIPNDSFVNSKYSKVIQLMRKTKIFAICSILNIILIYYEFADLAINNSTYHTINTIFSLIFMFEFISNLIFFPSHIKISVRKLDLLNFILISIDMILKIYDSRNIFIEKESYLSPFIDILKILQIFKLMRKSNNFFLRSISKLMKEILCTVIGLWDFIAIIFIAWLVCSFIGLELLEIPFKNFNGYNFFIFHYITYLGEHLLLPE